MRRTFRFAFVCVRRERLLLLQYTTQARANIYALTSRFKCGSFTAERAHRAAYAMPCSNSNPLWVLRRRSVVIVGMKPADGICSAVPARQLLRTFHIGCLATRGPNVLATATGEPTFRHKKQQGWKCRAQRRRDRDARISRGCVCVCVGPRFILSKCFWRSCTVLTNDSENS